MTTNYVQFEQAGIPRDDRVYDAATMLERLVLFFHEDGCTEDDWRDRCYDAWERVFDDD